MKIHSIYEVYMKDTLNLCKEGIVYNKIECILLKIRPKNFK